MNTLLPLHVWNSAERDFLQAVQGVDFYLQLLTVGVSVSVAWLAAVLLRLFLKRHTVGGGKFISWPTLKKLTGLLPPFFAVLFTAWAKALTEHHIQQTGVIYAALDLTMAWLLARIVLFLVEGRAIGWFISAVIFIYTLLDVTGMLKSTSAYLSGMAFDLGRYRISMLGLVHGIVIFVIVFWLASSLSQTLEAYLRRSTRLNYASRELLVKFLKLAVYFVAFVITMNAIGVDLTALAVFGGALGVGAGLGLQRITANFVSGIIILLEKSVKIGDLIEVNNYLGWVRMLQMRYTLLETFDGREVLVPNEDLISSRVTNWTYTNANARVEVPVTLVYSADARLARRLMLECAISHPFCQKDPAPGCYIRQLSLHGIEMLLTFWIPDIKEGRYGPQSDVLFSILEAFRKHNIPLYTDQPALLQPPFTPSAAS